MLCPRNGNLRLEASLVRGEPELQPQALHKINLEKMGFEVMLYGYEAKLGPLSIPIRLVICRSSSFRKFIQQTILSKVNDAIEIMTYDGESFFSGLSDAERRELKPSVCECLSLNVVEANT